MKAPDKIYLHKIRDEENSGYYKMWFESRARCVPSEEFIRKDALLDWLYPKITIFEDKYVRRAFQEVIDKIESM